MRAAWNPNLEILKTLLSAGADVKAKNKDGATSLHYAAASNSNPEIVTALLKAGIDINEGDKDKTTPLMNAARFNPDLEIFKTLLGAGADKEAQDKIKRRASDYLENNKKISKEDYWKVHDLLL